METPVKVRSRNARTRKRPHRRDIKKEYSRKQLAARLRRLAAAIERGKAFRIRVAGEALRVPAKAVASVEHEREGRTQELEFQLKWTTR